MLCAEHAADLSHPHNCCNHPVEHTTDVENPRHISCSFSLPAQHQRYNNAAIMLADNLPSTVFGVSPRAWLDGNATPVKNASAAGAKHAQTATSPPITRPTGAMVSDNLYPLRGVSLFLLVWLRRGSVVGIARERDWRQVTAQSVQQSRGQIITRKERVP